MVVQPTGTVTLLFTDVEGSTLLLERLGAERFAEVLALHRRVLRRRSPATVAMKSMKRAMPSWLLFRLRVRRSRPRVKHSRAWRRWCGRTRVGCGCGWGCIPGSPCRRRRSMWAWMWPSGSPEPPTALTGVGSSAAPYPAWSSSLGSPAFAKQVPRRRKLGGTAGRVEAQRLRCLRIGLARFSIFDLIGKVGRCVGRIVSPCGHPIGSLTGLVSCF